MIECSCAYDGDCEGSFGQWDTDKDPGYHKCSECGDTIWPWQNHRVGYWWDCSCCSDYQDIYDAADDDDDFASCEDAQCDGYCAKSKDPDSVNRMCGACSSAVDSLLCRCWWIGEVWDRIADQNEMSKAECLGR